MTILDISTVITGNIVVTRKQLPVIHVRKPQIAESIQAARQEELTMIELVERFGFSFMVEDGLISNY